MKKNKGVIILILTVLVTAFLIFTAAVGWGPTGTGAAKNIKTGLDLSGGVSITYQTTKENPTSDEMKDTIHKLQKRVDQYSTEAQVYQEGDNRINVEIPGVTDANAILEELGKPGSLEFQDAQGNVVLVGSDVEDAQGVVGQDQTTQNKEYVVSLKLTKEGTAKFAEATQANLQKQIAIVYDGDTLSAPTVQTVISDGNAQISGMASIEEAKNLASAIRIGSLKLELEELRSNVVAAQLGEEAISTSIKAAGIGIALVILLMAVVYLLPGVVSGVALVIYVCLDLIALNAFDITLTLPGIAGIILSIGMAVDANVIIYARIKEEIATGKSVKASLQAGFKKAFSSIFDGNITTLIAAFVLNWMGSGSVKGFAQTLALGIVISMFTALVISRLIIYSLYAVGVQNEKFYGMIKERAPIDFLGKKKIFFAISIILTLAAPAAMVINHVRTDNAFNYNLEFKGGTSTNVTFNEDLTIKDIDGKVIPVVEEVTGDGNVQAQKVVNSNQVIIKTRELSLDEREQLNQAMIDNFQVDDTKITAESISSTISTEMRTDAIFAVVVALILMLIYIWFRFKDIRFAGSGVLALAHDIIVVVAFYAISRTPVGNTFIAVLLTILGYCINATIVIFDRIRENLKSAKRTDDLSLVVNKSITQTLTRSIYTSLTTFIMVFFLFIMGVTSIREFALPLIIGIVCGVYSDVCVTGALWYVFKTKFSRKRR